jgi:hypothetical protein
MSEGSGSSFTQNNNNRNAKNISSMQYYVILTLFSFKQNFHCLGLHVAFVESDANK